MPPGQKERQPAANQKGFRRKSSFLSTMLMAAGLAGVPTGTCIAGMAPGRNYGSTGRKPEIMSAEKTAPGPCIVDGAKPQKGIPETNKGSE